MQVEQLAFVEATGELMLPEVSSEASRTGSDTAARRRKLPTSFAGFRISTILLVAVILGLLAWNAWMTREVVALKHQKIVSVSLASIITDFVHDQSRAQGTPDEAAARTRAYLTATQHALLDIARGGSPVVASEAVLGNSVPDETGAVKAAVARAMAAQAGQH